MTDNAKGSRLAAPLSRQHMPRDFAISLDRYVGRDGIGGGYVEGESRIPADFGPSQPMRGFEEIYPNIIDYIVRITYKIWEDRDVEYIADTYSDTSQVFDDYGLQHGCNKIIADTHHTTGAFSDIRLIADEIIWAGDDDIGYHTSHRTLIRGTNDGDSKYGPATNKSIDVLVIANCVALENEIFLEHVLYNNSSMLQQLGHDLGELVPRLAAEPFPGWPRDATTWDSLRNSTRPEQPISIAQPIDGFDPDRFSRTTMDAIWNSRNYELLSSAYVNDFPFAGPTDRVFSGTGAYHELIASIQSAFPDLELQVDEVYWMGNDSEGYLTSTRWSAEGTHGGAGLYGEPTGKSVQIWGITQHRIVAGRITEEWLLFNELDLLMQLAAD